MMTTNNGVAGITRSIATSSALNPTLILSAICTPTGLLVANWNDGLLQTAAFAIARLPPLVAIWQIVHFTNKDPDRLQNDKHVENKMIIAQSTGMFGAGNRELTVPPGSRLGSNPNAEGEVL